MVRRYFPWSTLVSEGDCNHNYTAGMGGEVGGLADSAIRDRDVFRASDADRVVVRDHQILTSHLGLSRIDVSIRTRGVEARSDVVAKLAIGRGLEAAAGRRGTLPIIRPPDEYPDVLGIQGDDGVDLVMDVAAARGLRREVGNDADDNRRSDENSPPFDLALSGFGHLPD
jgi:hypothetical protein